MMVSVLIAQESDLPSSPNWLSLYKTGTLDKTVLSPISWGEGALRGCILTFFNSMSNALTELIAVGMQRCIWLRHCATRQEVTDPIPDEVTGFLPATLWPWK
jgi:hypothetical protein